VQRHARRSNQTPRQSTVSKSDRGNVYSACSCIKNDLSQKTPSISYLKWSKFVRPVINQVEVLT
jgi:hypothetical protein